jgi:hypothetical protein
MVLLAALPFGLEIAIALSTLVGLSLTALATALAPKIEVSEGQLTAGRFAIPLQFIGDATALDPDESRFARGPGLNANARLMLRGDIPNLVKIEIVDASDPTPYILISTRRGDELVGALRANRA